MIVSSDPATAAILRSVCSVDPEFMSIALTLLVTSRQSVQPSIHARQDLPAPRIKCMRIALPIDAGVSVVEAGTPVSVASGNPLEDMILHSVRFRTVSG